MIQRVQAEGSRPLRLPVPPRAAAAFGAVAAAALLLFVVPLFQGAPQKTDGPPAADPAYVGEKGAVGLELYGKRADEVFRVHEGMTLLAGDMIRFVPKISDPGPHFIMVISVDSRGSVNRYYPEDSHRAQATSADGAPLPGSIVLDSTPGAEQIWLLSDATPFDFHQVEAAARLEWQRTGRPDRMEALPVDAAQVGIVIFKDAL